MATATRTPIAAIPEPEQAAPPIPPLENGDRLTRAEFERRFDAMPHLKKAELIEGIVYMASPVRLAKHGKLHLLLIGWVDHYLEGTPGADGAADSSVRLDLDNMPQPDVLFYLLPEFGGRIRISEDDYVEVAPELVAEVASSSASYDLHAKLNVYQRNGAREYLVWRTRDRAVDWFVLREGRYERLAPGADGIYRSEVFPGLWLDPAALIRGDRPTLARIVREGLASPEHAAFLAGFPRPEPPA